MNEITRSTGIGTGYMGLRAGGGYSGATESLDAVVQNAARALADAYSMDVVIRFNSDRESGGAWLKTHTVDGVWNNAEVGVCASLVTEQIREGWTERLTEEWLTPELVTSYREDLIHYPAGTVLVFTHITAEAALPELLDELRALPGWNCHRSGYHHGEAASVADAVARCLRFAPTVT